MNKLKRIIKNDDVDGNRLIILVGGCACIGVSIASNLNNSVNGAVTCAITGAIFGTLVLLTMKNK